MAKYILEILKSQLMVMWSWGACNFYAIENGLQFTVSGFKFKGNVRVVYVEGKDLFDVLLIKKGKVVKQIKDVYLDSLVEVIDVAVEKVANYEEKVKSIFTSV